MCVCVYMRLFKVLQLFGWKSLVCGEAGYQGDREHLLPASCTCEADARVLHYNWMVFEGIMTKPLVLTPHLHKGTFSCVRLKVENPLWIFPCRDLSRLQPPP